MFQRQWQVDWIQGLWLLLWLRMGAAALWNLSLGYSLWFRNWIGSASHCLSSGRLNPCSHIVVSWFLVILSAHSRAILEQVHMKMLWLWRPPPPLSSSLLEAFVIQSALFVQLEISTGITPHLPRSWSMLETLFLDFKLPHAASESLLKPFILFGTES